MKIIKYMRVKLISESLDEFLNESLFGEISRLNPKRYKNDIKGIDLFNEIKNDFIKNGKDLMKVSLIITKTENVEKIEIGKNSTLTYIFGKYHPVNNNIYTGNTRSGNRIVKIVYTPLSFTFKRNELEKAFKTSRFNNIKIRVNDRKVVDNPDYNPNISSNLYKLNLPQTNSDRKKMVRFHTVEDSYYVSPDISYKIIDYFIKEYNIQYPDIKGEYLSPLNIKDVKSGVQPTLKYINVKNKYGENLTVSIRNNDDEKQIINLVKNMSSEEYDQYYQNRNKELYKDSDAKRHNYENIIKSKLKEMIESLINKYGLDAERTDYRIYEDNLQINFILNMNINDSKNIINKMCNELEPIIYEDNEYVYTRRHVGKGHKNDNMTFITIIMDNKKYEE